MKVEEMNNKQFKKYIKCMHRSAKLTKSLLDIAKDFEDLGIPFGIDIKNPTYVKELKENNNDR